MIDRVLLIAQFILAAAIVLTTVRVWLGPRMTDRVIALDLLAVLSVGVMAVQAIRTGQTALIDVAVVVGLTAFIGTAAFAVLIGRGPEEERPIEWVDDGDGEGEAL